MNKDNVKQRAISLFLLIAIWAVFLINASELFAAGSTSVKRGGSVSISWSVAGAPSCVASFEDRGSGLYPFNDAFGETVGDQWLYPPTTRAGVGSETFPRIFGNMSQPFPQTYRFRCTDQGTGANDFTDLIVEDCLPSEMWVGNACVNRPTVSSFTVSSGSCTISTNQSTCPIGTSWSISNSISPSLTLNGVAVNTNPVGSNVQVAVTYGNHTLRLQDSGTVLDTRMVSASCGGSDTWNGTRCVSVPPTAPLVTTNIKSAHTGTNNNTASAFYGEYDGIWAGVTTYVSWSTPDPLATQCTVFRNGVAVPGATYPYPAVTQYNIPASSPILANTNFYVTCTNGTVGTSNTVTFVVPPPPTNVNRSCAADGQSVTMSWTNAPGYNTFYARNQDTVTSNVTYINDGIGNSQTFAGLVPGRQYYWWAHTRDSSGAWSQEVGGENYTCNVKYPNLVPGPVNADKTSVAHEDNITFTATIRNEGEANAAPYTTGVFYIDVDNNGWAEYTAPASPVLSNTPVGASNQMTATWTVPPGAPVAATYRVGYFADPLDQVNEGGGDGPYNASNWSGWSSNISVTTRPEPIISNFTATPSTLTVGEQVNISWTVTGDTNACWRSNTAGDPTWDNFLTIPGSGNQNVTPSNSGSYNLQCWNMSVPSPVASVSVTVNPATQLNPVTIETGTLRPINSQCAISNGGRTSLQWSQSSNVPNTGVYRVQVIDGSGTPVVDHTQPATQQRLFTTPSGVLIDGEMYTYRVRAEAPGFSPSDWSSPKNQRACAPPKPTGNEATELPISVSSSCPLGGVRIEWDDYTGDENGQWKGYRILRDGVSLTGAGYYASSNQATTTYHDWTAIPGNTYTYRVTAVSKFESAASDPISVPVADCGTINLTSDLSPLTVNGSLIEGQTVTFNGRVRNIGTNAIAVPTQNEFSYCWGAGCTNFSSNVLSTHNVPAPFASGAAQPDTSAALSLSTTGILRVQHCIDRNLAVAEANESDNCVVTEFTVSPAPVYSCIGPDPVGGNLCAGDSTGLSMDTAKQLVNVCTALTKCEYTCGAGYTYSGGICRTPVVNYLRVCDDAAGTIGCVNIGDTKNVNLNDVLYVHWDSSFTDRCDATGSSPADFSTGTLVDGSDQVTVTASPGTPVTYGIRCSKDSIGATALVQTITLNVNHQKPTLNASQSIVAIGSSVKIIWDSNNTSAGQNESSCRITGGGLTTEYNPINLEGDPEQGETAPIPINGRTTFTMVCPTGTATKVIDVRPQGWES